MTLEDAPDRAHRRNPLGPLFLLQNPPDFSGSPKRMSLADRDQPLLRLFRHGVGMRVRRPRLILQPLHPSGFVALQPLVPRLSRHSEISAQLRHRPALAVPLLDKP